MQSDQSSLPHPGPARSIIIPFYNEAANVQTLLAELRAVIEPMPGLHEVVAVDDGSTDATLKELLQASQDWPLLRVIGHPRNCGQAAALWTGFKESRGQIIITLDGDGQNDPSDITLLLRRLQAGTDMVTGVRASRRDSVLRKVMSRMANSVRSRLLQDGVHDSGCALKAFRREVCESFVPIRTLYSFMPAMAVAAGFQVAEITVKHRERKAGISKYGLGVMLWRPLVDMLGMWWFISRRFREVRP